MDARTSGTFCVAFQNFWAPTRDTESAFARRSVLESIAKTLEQFVFEEVPPAAIKRARVADDGSGDTEYLVEWLDDFCDSWVSKRDVADDLVRDFENGLEYAVVKRAYEPPSRQCGPKKNRRRLVAWADGAPPTWEP